MADKRNELIDLDDLPDWAKGFLRKRLVINANSTNTVRTYLGGVKEFIQWVALYLPSYRQPANIDEVREKDISKVSICDMAKVEREDIEVYLSFIATAADNKPATRAKKLSVIQEFFEYLVDNEDALKRKYPGVEFSFEYNPARKIRHPKLAEKKPIYLIPSEVSQLLNSLTGRNGVRDYAMYLLMITTGLRLSEVCNLDKKDINFEQMRILVRNGKGAKDRTIPITENCMVALKEYFSAYRDPIPGVDPDAVFVSKKGKGQRMSGRAIEMALEKNLIKCGLGAKSITPHKLRHTCASILAAEGVPMAVIQEIMGHRSADTTQIYVHLDQNEIQEYISRSVINEIGTH